MRVFAAENEPCVQCSLKRLPKANELPFYEKLQDKKSQEKVVQPSSLEKGISVVRRKVFHYISAVDVFWNQAVGFCNTGVEHSKSTYDYITQEENIFPRTMTIASGGLIGLLLAARGGAIKKISYSSVGLGVVSAACYPKEAKSGVQAGFHIMTEKLGDAVKGYRGSESVKPHEKEHKSAFSTVATSFENVAKSIKSFGSKIYPMDKLGQNDKKEGDIGQSNPKDSDMYSTRS